MSTQYYPNHGLNLVICNLILTIKWTIIILKCYGRNNFIMQSRIILSCKFMSSHLNNFKIDRVLTYPRNLHDELVSCPGDSVLVQKRLRTLLDHSARPIVSLWLIPQIPQLVNRTLKFIRYLYMYWPTTEPLLTKITIFFFIFFLSSPLSIRHPCLWFTGLVFLKWQA